MSINKLVLFLLVSCFLQSNCMKRKPETDIDNETGSNKKILPDINAKDENGDTLLIKACKQGNLQAVISLLENKADPNIPDKDKNTPLIITIFYIAKNKDNNQKDGLEIIKYLIQQKDIKIDHENNSAQTALISTIQSIQNPIEIVNLLLKHGANPNHPYYNMNPLIMATRANDLPIMLLLIDRGANFKYVDLLNTISIEKYKLINATTIICRNDKAIKMLIWSNLFDKRILSVIRGTHTLQHYQEFKNKIDLKYNIRTNNCNAMISNILQQNKNYLPNDLILIICNYYVEQSTDTQSDKRQILVNDILYSIIKNRTNLPEDILEIIVNYSSINSTDLENYCS